jgi:hypothetical protein
MKMALPGIYLLLLCFDRAEDLPLVASSPSKPPPEVFGVYFLSVGVVAGDDFIKGAFDFPYAA